jgi:hypothetical protein
VDIAPGVAFYHDLMVRREPDIDAHMVGRLAVQMRRVLFDEDPATDDMVRDLLELFKLLIHHGLDLGLVLNVL